MRQNEYIQPKKKFFEVGFFLDFHQFLAPGLRKSLSLKIAKSPGGNRPNGPQYKFFFSFFEYRHDMRRNEYIQTKKYIFYSDFSRFFSPGRTFLLLLLVLPFFIFSNFFSLPDFFHENV